MNLLLYALLFFITSEISVNNKEVIEVTINKLESLEIGNFIGVVNSLHESHVSTLVEGQIISIASTGDIFRKGEVVAKLLNSSLIYKKNRLLNQRKEVEILFEFYKKKGSRYKHLKDNNAISNELYINNLLEIDRNENKIFTLNDAIEEINYRINSLKIRAPFNGVVTEKSRDIGDWVKEGESIIVFQSTENFQMQVGLPISYIDFIKPSLDHVKLMNKELGIQYDVQSYVPPTKTSPNFFTLNINLKGKESSGNKYYLSLKISGYNIYKIDTNLITKMNIDSFVISYNKYSHKYIKHIINVIRYEHEKAIIVSKDALPKKIIFNENEYSFQFD